MSNFPQLLSVSPRPPHLQLRLGTEAEDSCGPRLKPLGPIFWSIPRYSQIFPGWCFWRVFSLKNLDQFWSHFDAMKPWLVRWVCLKMVSTPLYPMVNDTCHFCKHATWNHLARHHVTFACQVSNSCHHLWLNALSGGWDQHTSPLLLRKTCADFESLALHFGNFVGSELSLLCDINPSEATLVAEPRLLGLLLPLRTPTKPITLTTSPSTLWFPSTTFWTRSIELCTLPVLHLWICQGPRALA